MCTGLASNLHLYIIQLRFEDRAQAPCLHICNRLSGLITKLYRCINVFCSTAGSVQSHVYGIPCLLISGEHSIASTLDALLLNCCSVCSNPAGARVLRQDPVECLFEFICSSNNHISRIHGMVERLCRDYGTPILRGSVPQSTGLEDPSSVTADGPAEEEQQQQQQAGVPDLAFYAFPSLEQLSSASEAALRAEGFGYRYAPDCSQDLAAHAKLQHCMAVVHECNE